MTDRDKELDEILKPLSSLNPSLQQMKRWKKIRSSGLRPKPAIFMKLAQLTAACLIGFYLGSRALVPGPENQAQENFEDGATIEIVYHKSE